MWAEVSETRMCDEKTEDVSLEPAGPQCSGGMVSPGQAGQGNLTLENDQCL